LTPPKPLPGSRSGSPASINPTAASGASNIKLPDGMPKTAHRTTKYISPTSTSLSNISTSDYSRDPDYDSAGTNSSSDSSASDTGSTEGDSVYEHIPPTNYIISTEFETSADPIRSSLQRYWVSKGSDINFKKLPLPAEISLKSKGKKRQDILNFEDGLLYDGISEEFEISISKSTLGGDHTDDATYSADSKLKMSSGLFSAMDELLLSQKYSTMEVYSLNCKKPIIYASDHRSDTHTGTPQVDISFVYNHEMPNYEQLISDQSIKESSLLNYYKDYEIIKDSQIAQVGTKKVKYDGKVRDVIVYGQNTRSRFDDELTKNSNKKSRTDTNIIVSESSTLDISSKNSDLLSLPFYIKINIGKSKRPSAQDDLSQNLKDIIMSDQSDCDKIMDYCLKMTSPGANPEYLKKRSFNYSYFESAYENPEQTKISLNKTLDNESILMMDALDMSQNLGNEDIILNSNTIPATLIGEGPISTTTGDYYLSREIKKLFDASETSKLQIPYSSLLAGKAGFYSTDVIFYKISKFDETDLKTPIQNIFIPNKGASGQTYIDFQVKYGKRYTYKIYAYKFISGLQYSLSVSKPLNYSAYIAELTEYFNIKDTLTKFVVKYENKNDLTDDDKYRLGSYKEDKEEGDDWISSETSFDKALQNFKENLAETKEDGSRISNKEESKKPNSSRESRSAQMRLALKALIKLYPDTTDSAGIPLRNIVESISEIIGKDSATGTTGVYHTTDTDTTGASSTDRDLLTKAKSSIEDFFKSIRDLISELESRLDNKNGFGDKEDDRKKKLQDAMDMIDAIYRSEDTMIDAIADVKRSNTDDTFDINSRTLSTFTYPVIYLSEIPYFNDAGAILDNPPIFPDINFVPYRGSDKNISFFINSGIGKIIDNPIVFSEEESQFISLFRESKKLNQVEPITFKSDESKNMEASFEIYRLKNPPSSYLDFSQSLYQTLAESFKGGIQHLGSVSFLEKIKPNVTYYYMFRQKDSRGVISNPSTVFSVLIVNEGGMTFPIIKEYEFPPTEKVYDRTMKKLINVAPPVYQISPTMPNASFEYKSCVSGDNISYLMGPSGNQLFGKTFKIRFTSKKTGRQIDLNVTFEATVA